MQQGEIALKAPACRFIPSPSAHPPESGQAGTWRRDGDRRIQRAVYDKAADIAVSPPVTTAAIDAVLLFDGVFLLREELFDRWDLRIFVSATFEKALDRSRIRDRTPLMSADEVEQRYRRRYLPSQQFYFEAARPTEHADIIVYNDEPRRPRWEARTF